MSRALVVRCEGCTNVRRESNHWFVTTEGAHFNVQPSDGSEELESDQHDVCGEDCMMKRLSKWIVEERA